MNILDQLARLLIILLSLGAIPYLYILFTQLRAELGRNHGVDRQVCYLLMFLFSVLLAISVLSLIITASDIYNRSMGNDVDLTPFSRLRSLFISVSNFLTAYSFYRLRRDNLIKTLRKRR